MSHMHDGHRPFFPFGNPFRRIIPKGSYLSQELLNRQKSFEEDLAERFKNLSKNAHLDKISLSWMKYALVSLSETHRDIQSLIADLQFPVSEWDEQWMDVYLDNSVKLLDICNGFSSELARLDQRHLLLQYILHLLGQLSGSASQEQLKKVHASLCEWMERSDPRSPKLNNMPSILRGLVESLYPTKVKNSSKGKVLMRAMYGVKVHTIFICSTFSAILLGSVELLVDVPILETCMWAQAFSRLQTNVNAELGRLLTFRKTKPLKELESVDQCVWKLASLTVCVGQSARASQVLQNSAVGTDPAQLEATNSGDPSEVSVLKETTSELGKHAEGFAQSLDDLSKEVGYFFSIVLAGRDELLRHIRMPAGKKESCT